MFVTNCVAMSKLRIVFTFRSCHIRSITSLKMYSEAKTVGDDSFSRLEQIIHSVQSLEVLISSVTGKSTLVTTDLNFLPLAINWV